MNKFQGEHNHFTKLILIKNVSGIRIILEAVIGLLKDEMN